MKEQDVRIIQLGTSKKSKLNASGVFPHSVFSYYSSIEVSKVSSSRNTSPLENAYRDVQDILHNSQESNQGKDYKVRIQQCIVAFTNVYPCGKNDIPFSFTHDQINKFWSNTRYSLFFLSMIKVPLRKDLDSTLQRIKETFKGREYLVYFSFEYDEIFIFYKDNGFSTYTSLLMDLNYSSNLISSNNCNDLIDIIDTITIYSFAKCTDKTAFSTERFGAYFRMGVIDYPRTKMFLDKCEMETDSRVKYWLLGRNDVAALNTSADLNWLFSFMEGLESLSSAYSTLDLSILIDPAPESDYEARNIESLYCLKGKKICTFLNEKRQAICKEYDEYCKVTKQKPDSVFLRFIQDIVSLIQECLDELLAEDLAVCLLPQFESFAEFIIGSFKKAVNLKKNKSTDDSIEEHDFMVIRKSINVLYINFMALINSTVHSSKLFVQIPNCVVTAFEMPPKIMAYYVLLSNKIKEAFVDENDCSLYGITISPKLVDELEVEAYSTSIRDGGDQFLSINIGEEMLYNPKRTSCILGHEIAHFVGNTHRNREYRKEQIIRYFCFSTLQRLLIRFNRLLNSDQAQRASKIDNTGLKTQVLFEMTESALQGFYTDKGLVYMNDIEECISSLFSYLLSEDVLDKVYQQLFPESPEKITCDNYINILQIETQRRLGNTGKRNAVFDAYYEYTYLRSIAKGLLWDVGNRYNTQESLSDLIKIFRKKVAYVFKESFADICTILLFNVSSGEYYNLVEKGYPSENPENELVRAMGVSYALLDSGIWNSFESIKNPVISDSAKDSSRLELENCFKLLFQDKEACNKYLSKNRRDLVLLDYLVPYLTICVSSITSQFSLNKNVKTIRDEYDAICNTQSMYQMLKTIREIEERYCVDERWNQ